MKQEITQDVRIRPVPESALPCADWQVAKADEQKPESLLVIRAAAVFVFPWFRFVYAEGDNTRAEVVFSTHAIQVTGQGLAALLAAVAGQRVIRVIEPSENEARFGVRGPGARKHHGPAVHSITVTKFGEDE